MLNLKELEEKLDEALAKETPESLTLWLLSQRAENPVEELTEVDDVHFMKQQFTPQRFGQAKFRQCNEELVGQYDYAMAA